ncbi:hypothetical protein EV702DRAFT_1084839 [Suillus placidus]|uniref:ribonuclease H n=1 Tax=Suillus placidus TaxID=48579 RepID=A0A9P7A0I4_9AGAM|nr:hypothetical protein EV702DRAFT_1084839 [Suillus placidus]
MEALVFMTAESHLSPPSSKLSSSTVSPAAISPPRSVAPTSSTFRPSGAVVANVKEDEPGYDVVYSDGACKGNGQVGSVAGVGVWWGWNDSRNIAERCPGDQTNNRAELIASWLHMIDNILRLLSQPILQAIRPLMIKTDSKYSIQCFESWFQTQWPIRQNAELINVLGGIAICRERAGPKVLFKHVRELPERDWEQLIRDLEKKPTTSMTIPEPASAIPYTSRVAFPAREPTPQPGFLSQAELDAYASCLLEPDDLESDF